MSAEESLHDRIEGDREATLVSRDRSLQSRISSVLALGLMSVLGLGSLTWYYTTAMMHQGRARQSAQALSTSRAQGDMPLPSLGRIDPPAWGPPATPDASPAPDLPPQQPSLTPSTLPEIPLGSAAAPGVYGPAPAKTPAELALERELSGAVFAPQGTAPAPAAADRAAGAAGAGG